MAPRQHDAPTDSAALPCGARSLHLTAAMSWSLSATACRLSNNSPRARSRHKLRRFGRGKQLQSRTGGHRADAKFLDEPSIDFELVKPQFIQMIEARISGAEIINHDTDPCVAQSLYHL